MCLLLKANKTTKRSSSITHVDVHTILQPIAVIDMMAKKLVLHTNLMRQQLTDIAIPLLTELIRELPNSQLTGLTLSHLTELS